MILSPRAAAPLLGPGLGMLQSVFMFWDRDLVGLPTMGSRWNYRGVPCVYSGTPRDPTVRDPIASRDIPRDFPWDPVESCGALWWSTRGILRVAAGSLLTSREILRGICGNFLHGTSRGRSRGTSHATRYILRDLTVVLTGLPVGTHDITQDHL